MRQVFQVPDRSPSKIPRRLPLFQLFRRRRRRLFSRREHVSDLQARARPLGLRGRVSFVLILFILVACWMDPASALESNKNIDQYGHDVWTSQNGLPGEAVYRTLQTPDGYLWLLTS